MSPRPGRVRPIVAIATIVTLPLALTLTALTTPTAYAEPEPVAVTDDFEERVVLSESFDSGGLPDGWRPITGNWRVEDGRLVVTAGGISRLTFGPHLDNYRFEATVRFESVQNSSRWLALNLDIAPDGSSPWWQAAMRSASSASDGIEFAQRTAGNTWNVPYAGPAPRDAGVGQDVRVAIEVRGSQATWYFDGERVLSGRIIRSADGVLGLTADNSTVSFDDIVITEIAPEDFIRDPGELPILVAHRGYSEILPENTLLAEVAAMRTGAEFFEIDVSTSADGVPIVMHDATVDRTTDGTGRVADLLSDDIVALDAGSWVDPAYANEPVPTLQDILDAMDRNPGNLMLEIKGQQTRAQVEHMIDLIKAAGHEDRVVIESFDLAVVGYARDYAPEIPRGVLRGTVDADPVAVARSVGAVQYNPNHNGGLIKAAVDALHEAGIAVVPYTINSPARWAELTEMGVDGIVSDRAGAFIGWREAHEHLAAPTPTPEPEPVKPSVSVVGISDGQEFSFDEQVVFAASRADAESVTFTLDGEPVGEGQALAASDLGLGEHVLRVEVSGPGGNASDEVTFRVVATVESVIAQVRALWLSSGHEGEIVTAMESETWSEAVQAVEHFVADQDQRESLVSQIEFLAQD